MLKLFITREGAARVLPTAAQALLTTYLSPGDRGDGPLFVSRSNTPLSANAVQQQIRGTAKRRGLKLSSSAGRRAQLQAIDLSPALDLPASLDRASESTSSTAMAASEKVERYRAAAGQPTPPAGLALGSDARGTPRRYR